MLIHPTSGGSLFRANGGRPSSWIILSDNDTRADVENPEDVFYNDMTPEHAQEIKKHLKQQSFQALKSKLTYAAYRHIPTTYLLCTKDNAIPIAHQQGMVQQARNSGVHITTVTLEAGHSPFCSRLSEVVAACQTSIK